MVLANSAELNRNHATLIHQVSGISFQALGDSITKIPNASLRW